MKTNPWYQPYLETAKNVGISFDDSWQTLQKPISRATFMLWMRQYAENFVYDEANATELPFQGGWKFREFVSSHSNKKISLPHTVTLEVEGDQMTVQFCNTMHAKVQASGINMLKTSGFASTKMYCEGDRMTLENAFHFTKAYWERLHDDMTLVIKTDAGEFFFDALHTSSKKANLDGNWKLHTYTLA